MRCDLSNKVSVVTGAARGIGQAIADRLADNGSLVFYTDIDEAGAAAAAQARGARSLRLDVTKPDNIAAVIDRIIADHGQLDILVNNAGVNTMAHRVTIDEFPRDEWDRILAVDLTGLYEMSRAAARVMRARGSGRIINIASIAGLVPLRLQCAFVAAKAVGAAVSAADQAGPREKQYQKEAVRRMERMVRISTSPSCRGRDQVEIVQPSPATNAITLHRGESSAQARGRRVLRERGSLNEPAAESILHLAPSSAPSGRG